MNTGLLWAFDGSTTELANEVQRAAQHYKKRTGREPNLCYGNPSQVQSEMMVDTVKVLPLKTVLVNHLWIGLEET